MKIKICGIKNIEDALSSCEAGADYLGFNFYAKSVRFISTQKCKEIVEELNKSFPNVICVGVFVNHSHAQISSILVKTKLTIAQLSGDENNALLKLLGNNAFKAIRPKNMEEANRLIKSLPMHSSSPAFLIDNFEKGSYGGTGKAGDWGIAKQLSKSHKFFLAGGLNISNIEAAISKVFPWGVDVASGVESERGKKDQNLIKQFIELANNASTKIQLENT